MRLKCLFAMSAFLVLIAFFFCTSVFAGDGTPIQGSSQDEAKQNIAAVQHQQTFVESTRGGTTLRVGIVVMDAGGSTDVSPKAQLYLTMFNESEMADAGSAHLITHLNELVSARRVEAGRYEVVVKRYDAGVTGEETVLIAIDARELSMEVRQMNGVEEFGFGWYRSPVFVTVAPG